MRGTKTGLPAALLLAGSWLLPATAWALDLGLALPSVLRLSGSVDDEGGYDYFFDLDHALAGGQRLLLTYGSGLAVVEDEEVEPRTLALGVSSDPLDLLTVSASIEDWGQEDEIKTRSLQADVRLRSGAWQFGLGARARRIEFFFSERATNLFPVLEAFEEITSEGAEYSVGVELGEQVYTSFRYFNNNYSRDPGVLDIPGTDRVLTVADLTSSVAFSLAAGLEEEGAVVSVSAYTDWGAVNVDWSQSVSAIDGDESDVLMFGADFDLSTATTLQLGVGRQRTEDEPDLSIASTALLINW